MIIKANQQELKNIIGTRYTNDVSKILLEAGEFNDQGKPYSLSLIRKVFIGNKSNAAIEAAILILAKRKKKETATLQNKISKILN